MFFVTLIFHISVPHWLGAGHEISLGQVFHWLVVKASYSDFMALNRLKLKKCASLFPALWSRWTTYHLSESRPAWSHWLGGHADAMNRIALAWIRSGIALNRLDRSKQVWATATAPIPGPLSLSRVVFATDAITLLTLRTGIKCKTR